MVITLIWQNVCSYYKYNGVYSKDWWLSKIFTVDEVKNFIVINFSEYFKSAKKQSFFQLNEEQNPKKVAESL